MLRVVTGCWHDSRTQEFVLHFNSSINNDPMCLPRPHRNRPEQPLLPTLTSLYFILSQEDKEHELISPANDMTLLDFFSGLNSSSVWSQLVHVAGNQGRDTKEGLIIAAVGRLHHIPPRLIISPAS